ncbi:MAG: hypothetical protein A2161_00785 [Candidatus Schekmanbacteria bacterium RBG_13_48_7]|uniref:Methyltransferase type 11 domain-containing protein n=1 Tax=Candidatus Schekmanbacteria bacterium RBG_13_48_7 TaxID=1817878 RepID=A0A1F7RVW0_9BACT|nr:MAG: hypothetical protein A2161_00785 [Candidatus Schekmanbacteria bacterium RBG_13_48_7]
MIDSHIDGLVADIGCGPGLFLKPLIPPVKVIGVDLSEEMLLLARKNFISPVQGNCYQLPLKSLSCHLVTCIGVLQCFEDPAPVIKELSRITHSKGSIIIVTHNAHSVIRKLAPRKGFKHLISKELIEKWFDSEGFHVILLYGIHYPSLKPRKINRFTQFHNMFCTTLIWRFQKN